MSLQKSEILSEFSHKGKRSRHGGQNKRYPDHWSHNCHLSFGYFHGWYGLGVKGQHNIKKPKSYMLMIKTQQMTQLDVYRENNRNWSFCPFDL